MPASNFSFSFSLPPSLSFSFSEWSHSVFANSFLPPTSSSNTLFCLLIFSNVFMYSFKSSVCAEAGAACNCWRPKAVLFFLAECTRQSSAVIISSLVTDGTSRFSVLNRIHYSNVSSTDRKGYRARLPVSSEENWVYYQAPWWPHVAFSSNLEAWAPGAHTILSSWDSRSFLLTHQFLHPDLPW